ncbi:unnamed protein product [Auanema sp. JU1783]|nr:unnamed protein product [Auanema sp. JU1783]
MSDMLKKYMDKMDDLAPFMRRSAEEIRDLDIKVQEVMVNLKSKTAIHLKNYKKSTREQRAKVVKEVSDLFKEAEQLSERKIALAQQMYDTVDGHICEIDKNVEKFNEYQIQKYNQETAKLNGCVSPNRKRRGSQGRDKKKKGSAYRTNRIAETGAIMESYKPKPLQITPALDMPVDPSEPIYCFCHQVSFGEMVGCDNKDCPYEWFHFQCLGISDVPNGHWFCDHCKDPKNQKKKK